MRTRPQELVAATALVAIGMVFGVMAAPDNPDLVRRLETESHRSATCREALEVAETALHAIILTGGRHFYVEEGIGSTDLVALSSDCRSSW